MLEDSGRYAGRVDVAQAGAVAALAGAMTAGAAGRERGRTQDDVGGTIGTGALGKRRTEHRHTRRTGRHRQMHGTRIIGHENGASAQQGGGLQQRQVAAHIRARDACGIGNGLRTRTVAFAADEKKPRMRLLIELFQEGGKMSGGPVLRR